MKHEPFSARHPAATVITDVFKDALGGLFAISATGEDRHGSFVWEAMLRDTLNRFVSLALTEVAAADVPAADLARLRHVVRPDHFLLAEIVVAADDGQNVIDRRTFREWQATTPEGVVDDGGVYGALKDAQDAVLGLTTADLTDRYLAAR